jgi:hypothetical protein
VLGELFQAHGLTGGLFRAIAAGSRLLRGHAPESRTMKSRGQADMSICAVWTIDIGEKNVFHTDR